MKVTIDDKTFTVGNDAELVVAMAHAKKLLAAGLDERKEKLLNDLRGIVDDSRELEIAISYAFKDEIGNIADMQEWDNSNCY